jgi:hypothetical protein
MWRGWQGEKRFGRNGRYGMQARMEGHGIAGEGRMGLVSLVDMWTDGPGIAGKIRKDGPGFAG